LMPIDVMPAKTSHQDLKILNRKKTGRPLRRFSPRQSPIVIGIERVEYISPILLYYL